MPLGEAELPGKEQSIPIKYSFFQVPKQVLPRNPCQIQRSFASPDPAGFTSKKRKKTLMLSFCGRDPEAGPVFRLYTVIVFRLSCGRVSKCYLHFRCSDLINFAFHQGANLSYTLYGCGLLTVFKFSMRAYI